MFSPLCRPQKRPGSVVDKEGNQRPHKQGGDQGADPRGKAQSKADRHADQIRSDADEAERHAVLFFIKNVEKPLISMDSGVFGASKSVNKKRRNPFDTNGLRRFNIASKTACREFESFCPCQESA